MYWQVLVDRSGCVPVITPIYPCIPAARDLGRYCSIWKIDWEMIFWCSFHVNIIHYGMGLWSDTYVIEASQAPLSKTLLVPSKQAQETQGFIKLDIGEILFSNSSCFWRKLAFIHFSPAKVNKTRLYEASPPVRKTLSNPNYEFNLSFSISHDEEEKGEEEDVAVDDDELVQTGCLQKPLC